MKLSGWPAAAALMVSVHTASGGPIPVTATQYVASVHAIRLQIDGLVRSGTASGGSENRISQSLRALATVRLGAAGTVHTSLPSIADELQPGQFQSVKRAARQLDLLDDALRSSHAVSARSADLQALNIVLRDPRFHVQRNPFQRLADWIGEQIQRLLSRLSLPSGAAPGLTVLYALPFLVLIASLALLLVRRALRRLEVEVGMSDHPGARPRTRLVAKAEADRYAAEGDFRVALRYLFLATLLGLQERGVLELRPGQTNREYLDSLRDSSRLSLDPVLERAFFQLVDGFDRVWYGHDALDRAGYQRYVALASEVESAAPSALVA